MATSTRTAATRCPIKGYMKNKGGDIERVRSHLIIRCRWSGNQARRKVRREESKAVQFRQFVRGQATQQHSTLANHSCGIAVPEAKPALASDAGQSRARQSRAEQRPGLVCVAWKHLRCGLRCVRCDVGGRWRGVQCGETFFIAGDRERGL